MIVLDASVLIAYFDGHDVHHARAETLLTQEVDEDFAANSVTLAEVLVMPARQQRVAAARTALQDLNVEELALPADTAVRLALLRATTNLKLPDCCVLLTAEHVRARLATFDDRLGVIAASRNIELVPG